MTSKLKSHYSVKVVSNLHNSLHVYRVALSFIWLCEAVVGNTRPPRLQKRKRNLTNYIIRIYSLMHDYAGSEIHLRSGTLHLIG